MAGLCGDESPLTVIASQLYRVSRIPFPAHKINMPYCINDCVNASETRILDNDFSGIVFIESGLYSIQINKTYTTLKFEKQNDLHKDMWHGFLALINQLLLKIDKTSSIGIHKINATELLEEARKCVTKNGSRVVGNWLSELRNQVNYQHLYGAWFPYDVRAIDERVVKIANSKWTYPSHSFNTADKQGGLERFFESTALLLSLLREMICICSENVYDEGSVFCNRKDERACSNHL